MSDLRVLGVAAPLRKQVVEVLRNAITNGMWLPGDRLGERELCEQTGVSRTLIRESLRQLETEGLIESIPNRGLFVSKINKKDAKDLYAVRAALEAYAGKLAATICNDEVVHKLKRSLDDLKFASGKNDLKKVMQAKAEFYEHLFAGAENELLCELLKNLHARTALLRATTLSSEGRLPESVKEIAKIVKAIESGNAEDASKAAAAHVHSAAQIAVELLDESDDSD